MKPETELSRRETSGKVHLVIIWIMRVLLVLAFIGAFQNERWLVLFVAALSFFVTFLPAIIHKTLGVRIPAEFEVMVILFIYGSLFFGEVRGFYDNIWWWDILLNLASAIALGFVGLTVLYVLYKDEVIDASPLIIVSFAFCFAVATGTIWEIFEFGIDRYFGFNMQKSGLADTMGDLVTNAIGAFMVSVGGYFYIRYGKENLISGFILRLIEKNPRLFRGRKKESKGEKLKKLIAKGESDNLEFKSTLRINLHTGETDRKIEHAVLKTITGYLNSQGGTLLVGVKDDGSILGMEKEGFHNHDKLNLHVTNLIKNTIGKEHFTNISFELVKMEEGKTVLLINCGTANRPVFLKHQGTEEFYMRNGPSTVQLTGSTLLDYVAERFEN